MEGWRIWWYVFYVRLCIFLLYDVIWRGFVLCGEIKCIDYLFNENKINVFCWCWDVFFEGKSIRCSYGGLIIVMLLDCLIKG